MFQDEQGVLTAYSSAHWGQKRVGQTEHQWQGSHTREPHQNPQIAQRCSFPPWPMTVDVPSCDQNPRFDIRSPCSIAIPTKTAKRPRDRRVAGRDKRSPRGKTRRNLLCPLPVPLPGACRKRQQRSAPRNASQTVCCFAGGPSLGMEDTVPCALGSDGGSQRNCRAPPPTQLTKRC